MGNWILGKDEITLQKNAEKRHKKDNLRKNRVKILSVDKEIKRE